MIVVDASALTAALVDDGPVGIDARNLLASDPEWSAPAHLPIEVAAALRGLALGGRLVVQRARVALRALRTLELDLIDPRILVNRTWDLRHNATAYDAAYLAAAEALGCPLITADQRLQGVPGVRCPVTVIGELATE